MRPLLTVWKTVKVGSSGIGTRSTLMFMAFVPAGTFRPFAHEAFAFLRNSVQSARRFASIGVIRIAVSFGTPSVIPLCSFGAFVGKSGYNKFLRCVRIDSVASDFNQGH